MKGFHDKKRRLNYYRVKLILWKKEGNAGPMEITQENSTNSNSSSNDSKGIFQETKFLKT